MGVNHDGDLLVGAFTLVAVAATVAEAQDAANVWKIFYFSCNGLCQIRSQTERVFGNLITATMGDIFAYFIKSMNHCKLVKITLNNFEGETL